MTQGEFIEILNSERYSYEIEGDKIVVTYEGGVYLNSLTSFPPGVEFNNGTGVYLYSLCLIFYSWLKVLYFTLFLLVLFLVAPFSGS